MPLTTRVIVHRGSHGPLANAKLRWTERGGALLEVNDGRFTGYGEATPLPGHSSESLEQAVQELGSLRPGAIAEEPPFEAGRQNALLDWLHALSRPLETPSARFALETALLDYWARRLGVPLWQLLVPRPVSELIHTSAVLDPLAADAEERAEQLVSAGVSTLKLKLGRDLERELHLTACLRRRWAAEKVHLRLDVNRAWSTHEAVQNAERFSMLDVELIEEPCPAPWPDASSSSSSPWAADESLSGVAPSAPWPSGVEPSLLVLKPMLLGGFSACLAWAARAQAAGKRVIISHLFDGPVALAATTHLAFAVQSPELAAGLGPHAGLEAWSNLIPAPSFVRAGRLALPRAAGLGVSPLSVPTDTSRGEVSLAGGAPPPTTPLEPNALLSPRAAARECPHRLALVLGDQSLTFAELGRAVELAMDELETSGAAAASRASGRPIAFAASTTLGALVRLYACFELRLPVLPLHPRWSTKEAENVLHRVRPAFVIRDGSTSAPPLHEALCTPQPDDLEADLAWLMTSGSTGAPKAARLSRRAFLASAAASADNLGWHADDRWLLSLPFAHVGGLSVLTRCLIARRTVVLDRRLEGAAWTRFLNDERVTLLSLVPTQLVRLLEAPGFRFPEHVRAVLLGGAPATPALLARARERDVPVLTTYGLTETCSQVATARYDQATSTAEPTTSDALGLVGPPLRDVDVRLTKTGTIALRGPMSFSGYADEPTPFDADGYLETSDLGVFDETGRLCVLGRRDSVILSGGENVAAESIEAELAQHPQVRALCVVGVPDPEWGERVIAVVELRSGNENPERALAELESFALTRLSGFRRPKLWLVRDELPLLPSGKLDRRAISAWARSASANA